MNTHWNDWCWSWSWSSNSWPPDMKRQLIGKDPDAGKDWGQEEKSVAEDEMVGWHHQLRELGQTLGDRRDREAWRDTVRGVTKSRSDWIATTIWEDQLREVIFFLALDLQQDFDSWLCASGVESREGEMSRSIRVERTCAIFDGCGRVVVMVGFIRGHKGEV